MSELMPMATDVNRPYWEAVERGELMCQLCDKCGHHWLPAREECPNCLSADIGWIRCSGRGKIISWVVYHRAFHPEFADKVPYNVAVVELEEGARMMTNIKAPTEGMAIDLAVSVDFDHDGDEFNLPRFRINATA